MGFLKRHKDSLAALALALGLVLTVFNLVDLPFKVWNRVDGAAAASATLANSISHQYIIYKPGDVPNPEPFGGNGTPFLQTSIPDIYEIHDASFRDTKYEGNENKFYDLFEEEIEGKIVTADANRSCFVTCALNPVGLCEGYLPSNLCSLYGISTLPGNAEWCSIFGPTISEEQKQSFFADTFMSVDDIQSCNVDFEALTRKQEACGCSESSEIGHRQENFIYYVLTNTGTDAISKINLVLERVPSTDQVFSRYDQLGDYGRGANSEHEFSIAFEAALLPGRSIAVPILHAIIGDKPSEDGPTTKGYDLFAIGEHFVPVRVVATRQSGELLEQSVRAMSSNPVSFGEGIGGAG